MNPKLLTAFLMVAAVTQGCIIHTNQSGGGGGGSSGGGGSTITPSRLPGDVTFSWSFSGRGCSDNPDVKSLKITIPGEALQNDGIYPCLAGGYPGITLHDFVGGGYSFTIQALSYSNEVLYTGAGSFNINGDVRVNIDLTPVGGPTSYAYLTWRFPANQSSNNPTCSQAGVTTVDVSIDGAAPYRATCTDGQTSPGLMTPLMDPGTHSITLTARSATGYVYYRFVGNLMTFSGNPVSADYAMPWAVGGAAIKWSITNGQIAQTCSQAGVTSFALNFRDADGNMLYGNNGDSHPCTSSSVVYDFLPAGNLEVFVVGYGSGNAFYSTNQNTPPVITVAPGVFVDGSSAVNVQVFRQ